MELAENVEHVEQQGDKEGRSVLQSDLNHMVTKCVLIQPDAREPNWEKSKQAPVVG